MEGKKRNGGIDLLRMLCMLMVAARHVLDQGGLLGSVVPQSPTYWVVSLLYMSVFCAVDCFGLISGYVGYGSAHRTRGLVRICLQATFYTVAATVVCAIAVPGSVGPRDLIKSLAPWAFELYWYLSAYFCLFFFMRYLDTMVAGLDERGVVRLLGVMLAVLSLFSTVMLRSDFAGMKGGFSFPWLAALYVAGACLRRMEGKWSFPPRLGLAAYAGCVLVVWGFKFAAEGLTVALLGEARYGDQLTGYTSPVVVLSAVGLLLFFSRVRVGGFSKRAVRFCAPLCFGVYLLHEEPHVREHLIVGCSVGFAELGPVAAVLAVVGTSVGIWVVGILVDAFRAWVFRVARVDAACDWVGARIDRVLVGDETDDGAC